MKYSLNVIYRDISRLGLFNLLFYALLRVINIIDYIKEAYLMPLIKNVVKEYIKAENYINLLAPIMTHNTVNFNAFSLIKEMKVEV